MYKILNDISGPEDIKGLSYEQLIRLNAEIRDFLLKSVSATGGHLSSNLGIVELSVSLHRIFDSPRDKIIFDVGHQGYVHKILTGRMDEFSTLRQYGGLSGFLKRSESIHDHFDAGHSSTSISVAAGFVNSRRIKNETNEVVAVIGDGAMTGGMAFEALNNLGHGDEKVIVVLNDNEMSISENVGGLSQYLSNVRTTERYFRMKSKTLKVLAGMPRVGHRVAKTLRRIKGSIKYFFIPGMFFEDLGFKYIGPVDGHDNAKLEKALLRAREVDGPVLVHVITKKGKGYLPAELNPDDYHGVSTFDLTAGIAPKKTNTFSDVFGDAIVELAEENRSVCAITAAMPDGTGLGKFRERFHERYIDVGIAEQHAVTMAAGMAVGGMVPVFAVYSTFLQRAYDQIVHDVCIQNLHVVLCIDRAGLVGQDGETHHGVFDIAFLKHVPNMTLLAPSSGEELRAMMRHAIMDMGSPVAIRYPRGSADMDARAAELIGSAGNLALPAPSAMKPFIAYATSKEPPRVTLIPVGNMVGEAVIAADMLSSAGISASVVNPRMIVPVIKDDYEELVRGSELVVTVEDGVIEGGFGQSIKCSLDNVRVAIMGYPDEFIHAGDQKALREKYGLSAVGIFNLVESRLKSGN